MRPVSSGAKCLPMVLYLAGTKSFIVDIVSILCGRHSVLVDVTRCSVHTGVEQPRSQLDSEYEMFLKCLVALSSIEPLSMLANGVK